MSPAPKIQASLKAQWTALMEQIPRAQKLLLISVGIATAAGAAGAAAVHKPWSAKRALLLSRQKTGQEKSALLSTLQRQAEHLERQKKNVLLQGGTSVLIGEVTRLASKAGLRIESVMPKTEVTFGPFTKLQIEVEATSNLQNLLGFLSGVERHEPLLKIDRMEVGEIPKQEAADSAEAGSAPGSVPSRDLQRMTFLISAFAQVTG